MNEPVILVRCTPCGLQTDDNKTAEENRNASAFIELDFRDRNGSCQAILYATRPSIRAIIKRLEDAINQ